jgi:hypothetical protein
MYVSALGASQRPMLKSGSPRGGALDYVPGVLERGARMKQVIKIEDVVEYRVKQVDGSWRWLSAWGLVECQPMFPLVRNPPYAAEAFLFTPLRGEADRRAVPRTHALRRGRPQCHRRDREGGAGKGRGVLRGWVPGGDLKDLLGNVLDRAVVVTMAEIDE